MSTDAEANAVPAGVYYDPEKSNFYNYDGAGMGSAFWAKWSSQTHLFPTTRLEARISRAIEWAIDHRSEWLESLLRDMAAEIHRSRPWEEIAFHDGVVFISDLGLGSCITCTKMVAEMLKKHGPGIRIVFRDSLGRWDELCHNGQRYIGFRNTTLRPPARG